MKNGNFNDYRFEGLNWIEKSNKYLTMNRVNEAEDRIVVKVAEEQLIKTRYGYALILDRTHVAFLKNWAASVNYYGAEVLLTKEYFTAKEWGEHEDYSEDEDNLRWETWLEAAKEQQALVDEDGMKLNPVRWEK